MYFCIAKDDNYFTVVDTSDGVEEKFSEEEIKNYLSQGVVILGVTLESLSINELTIVLIDFPSRAVRTGQVFNGYFFESYNEETYDDYHNIYLHSILKSTDCNVFDILSYLQASNDCIFKKILSSIPNSDLGYTTTTVFDNGLFNVRELPLGNEYGFSYSDVCSSLLYDKLRVEGFSDITKEKITIWGRDFSLKDSIKYNLSDINTGSTFFCEQVNCKSDCVDSISVTSAGLTTFIEQYGDKKLSKNRFPMVSLFDYCKREPLHYGSKLNSILKLVQRVSGSYKGREGYTFKFDTVELDGNSAIAVHNLFKLSNTQFYNDVEQYIKLLKAKTKLLKGIEQSDEPEENFRVNNNYYKARGVPFVGVKPYISKEVSYNSLETNFGVLLTATYIRDEDTSRISSIGGLSLYRITNTANFYYRIGRSGITIHLSSKNKKYEAKNIIGNGFAKHLDVFRDDIGYYYNRPNIVPLFIHNVVEHDDGIEINVLVAVNTNDYMSFVPQESGDKSALGKKKGWGITLLVVPLLLTGTRHYFSDDFVIFDMLFQELAISKTMYNNLLAEVDEFNDLICIDNCSETSSLKLCNCSIGESDSKNVTTFKKIVSNSMVSFNNKIETLNYFI